MEMVIFSGIARLPFVRTREDPEFAALLACNRGRRPRCLAWHGWLPKLIPY